MRPILASRVGRSCTTWARACRRGGRARLLSTCSLAVAALFLAAGVAVVLSRVADVPALPDGADVAEPNNSRDKATLLTPEQQVTATLFPRGDRDFYTFTLDTAARVTVKATGPSPAVSLMASVLDEQGHTLAQSNAGPGRSLLLVSDLRAGKHFLEVRDGPHDEFDQYDGNDSGESRAPYHLTCSVEKVPDASEPNDDPKEARELELGKTTPLWIFPAGDRDRIRVKIPDPGSGELRITAAGVAENISLLATVTAPQGGTEHRQAPPGKPLSWSVRTSGGGEYQLALEAGAYQQQGVWKGAGTDGSTQPIQLKVEFAATGDPAEPNNDVTQAAPLAPGTAVTGTIFPAGDADYYKLNIPEGKWGWLRVDLDGLPDSIHPSVAVFNKDRQSLQEVRSVRGSPVTLIQGVGPGDYYLCVRSREYHNGLHWEASDSVGSRIRYTLRPQFLTAEVDEREPNSQFETAGEVALGESRACLLAPENDHDYFRFTLQEGDPDLIQVVVSGLNPRVFTRLALYNEHRQELAGTRLHRDGYHVLNARLGPGTYYFLVAPGHAHNGSYAEGTHTQFQRKPYHVGLLPLYRHTQAIDKTPHHLGDRAMGSFAKPEPEGLVYRQIVEVPDPAEHDAVILTAHSLRHDTPAERGVHLAVNGKDVAWINRFVPQSDSQARTFVIDLPAGLVKPGRNEIVLRTNQVEGQGTENWEFRYLGLGRRFYYHDSEEGPVAAPRQDLGLVPMPAQDAAETAAPLAIGKWQEFRIGKDRRESRFVADLSSRGFLRLLLPGPHWEVNPDATLYQVIGDLDKPAPRVLYLRGSGNRTQLDQFFPEIAFTRIDHNSKEAGGALLDLSTLQGFQAIIVDGLADLAQFDFASEKAQANLAKFAETGKRVLVLDPLCDLEKVGVKSVGMWEAREDRTIDLPTVDPLFAGDRGASAGWPGPENGCRFTEWQKRGMSALAADETDPENAAVTIYRNVGKGAIVFESMLLGHPQNQPHARSRLHWLLGLETRLHHVGQASELQPHAGRDSAKLWTSPVLAAGKYVLRLHAQEDQNADSLMMLLRAEFFPVESAPDAPGSQFATAQALDPGGKRLTHAGKIEEFEREHWFRLRTSVQEAASVRLEVPDELDLAIDLYRGEVKPTGKRVLYLRGPFENHNLDKFFPDVQWEPHTHGEPHAQRLLLDPARLKGYDAIVVDAIRSEDQFGLNQAPVLKAIEQYVRGGGRFVMLSPVGALSGFGLKSENPGHATSGKTFCIGDEHELLRAFKGRWGTLDYPREDEVGAFSGWSEAGYAPLFRHLDQPDAWATAVAKKLGDGYYILDAQRIGAEDTRGASDWKLYLYLGIAPACEYVRRIDNTFGRSFGGPEHFDLPAEEAGWVFRIFDWGNTHRSPDPFTLTIDPLISSSPEEPNDTRKQATPLPTGRTLQGKLFPAGDRDLYRLEVESPGLLRVYAEHPAENIDLDLKLVPPDSQPKKVLYLRGGRSDYNVHQRRLAGVEFTALTSAHGQSLAGLLPGFDAVIVDGLTSPNQFGMQSTAVQNAVLTYVEQGGTFVLLCPQIEQPKDVRFWGVELVPGWRQNNVAVVDPDHPLHQRRAMGQPNGWPASETFGHFVGWKDAGFHLVYADAAEKEKHATVLVKKVGKGLLILDALEVGYPQHADVSLWHLANLLDAPLETTLDASPDGRFRPGTPRHDERIVRPGTYFLTVSDNPVQGNWLGASPLTYALRADFLAMPELSDDAAPPADAMGDAKPTSNPATQPATSAVKAPAGAEKAADLVPEIPASVLLWPSGKVAWFRFATPGPGKVTLLLSGVPDAVDPVVELYRAADFAKPWKQLNNTAGKAHGGPEYGEFETGSSEAYYVKVYDREGVRASPTAMRLQVGFTSVDCPLEPNSEQRYASPLVPEHGYSLNLFPARDTDWFGFTVADQASFEATCSDVPPELSVRLQVFAADDLQRPLHDAEGKPGENTVLKVELAKGGTYYLVLRAGAGGVPSADLFRLSVAYRPDGPLPPVQIAGQWPAPSVVGAFPDAPIKVSFTKPIKPEGMDGALTVLGSRSGRIAGKTELDRRTNILTFRPSAPFSPGERITASLEGVREVDGTASAAKAQWAFEVGTPRIADTVAHVSLPRRKLGIGRHPVVVWSTSPLTEAPSVTCQFSDGTVVAVSDLAPQDGGKWHGTLVLPPGAPSGPARIAIAGKDAAGRKLQRIAGDTAPEVDAQPPSTMTPVALEQRPQGKLVVTWSRPREVADLAGYHLYRSAKEKPAPAEQTLVAAISSPDTTFYEDLPAEDGTYFYAVAAVDDAANIGPLTAFVRGISVRSGPKLPVADFTGKVEKGRVTITWKKSTEPTATGYLLHRFSRPEDAAKLDPSRPYRRLSLNEQWTADAPADGEYTYVVAVHDAAGNSGPASEPVKVVVDTQPPRGNLTLAAKPPLRTGDHAVTLKVNEKLRAAPVLKARLPNSAVRDVPLKAADDSTFQGVFSLSKDDPDGTVYFTAEGEDLHGNVGIPIDSGAYVQFDNAPPRIRVVTDPPGRFKRAGPVRVVVHFSEAVAADPTFAFTLGGKTFPLALKRETEQRYAGVMEVAHELPNGPAKFQITAVDAVGHTGGIFEEGEEFVVKTLAPGPPTGVRARAAAGSMVEVRWSAPLGERVSFFRLYAGESDEFQVDPKRLVQDQIHDVQFLHRAKDEKPVFYRVTAVDPAGNESQPSAVVRAEPRGTPPVPPTEVVVEVQKDGRVKVAWKAQANEKEELRFLVYRTQEENADLSRLEQVATATEMHALERPPGSGDYYYHVVAQDQAGNVSPPARSARVTYDLEPPIAAVQLAPVHRSFDFFGTGGALWRLTVVNAGRLQVTLKFSEPLADAPQLRYRTRASEAPHGVPLAQEGDHYIGQLDIARSSADGLLEFMVTAKDRFGNVGSAFSVGERFWIDTTPPEAPGGLAVKRLPLGKLDVSWSVPQGERADYLRYHLYRSTKPITTNEGIEPLTVVERELRFVDTPAEEGEYHYAIVAEDLGGNLSAVSASVASASDTTPPAPPSSLSATIEKQVLLQWKPPPEKEVRYRLYRATSAAEVTQQKQRLADELNEVSFSDLPQGDGTYHYAVTTVDASGNESPASNVVSVDFVGRVPRATIATEPEGTVRTAFKVALSSSLPLVEAPQVFLQHALRSDPVPLRKVGEDGKHWEGTFDLPPDYPAGRVTFAFRGVSAGGFVGTGIDGSAELTVDTRPPTARIVLPRPSPLPAGTHEVTLTASEPLAQVPKLLLTTLGAAPRNIELSKVDAQVYRGSMTLTRQDRDGTAVFTFEATDLAGNEARLENLDPFEIDHHVPKPPSELKTRTMAGGDVELIWHAPLYQASETFDRIAGYHVYRSERPTEDLTGLTPAQSGVLGLRIVDRPEKDGEYYYAVVTVDASGLTSPPTPWSKGHSDRTPPLPPRIVELKQLPTGIGIAWEADEGPASATRFTVLATVEGQPVEGQPEAVVVVKDFAGTRTEHRPLVDGTYVLRATAADEFGNESSPSLPQSLAYKQLAPVASLTFSKPTPWGEGPVDITLTANRALVAAPNLQLVVGEKQIPVQLTGSGTSWKGSLNVEAGFTADRGEFQFRAVAQEQGADLEGTAILDGREVRFDFTPPTVAVRFDPAVPTRDRRVLLKGGRYDFIVEASEPLKTAPSLTFTPQGKEAIPITLSATAPSPEQQQKWSGSLIVDDQLGEGAGLLEFEGTDLHGNAGKQISAGANVFVRLRPPAPVGKLRAASLPAGRVRLDWAPPLLPSGEPDPSANRFFVYRAESEIRAVDGLTPLVELHRNLGYVDHPGADRHYFYTVVAVDEAGNASEPATGASAHVDKTPPGPPRDLVVSELPTGAVKLTWQPPTGEAAAYYRVYLEKFPIQTTRGLQPKNDVVPITEVYGTPNEDGQYYFAVTAVDHALNEGEPGNVVYLDYKTIAPMAFFTVYRGERAPVAQGALTVETATPLSRPPQLLVKGPGGDPRRVSMLAEGRTWSARIAPATLFKLQADGGGAEAPYRLELTTPEAQPAPPRVFFHGDVGDPKTILFHGEGRRFEAELQPRSFFRADAHIWITDGRYTVTLSTTEPLREPPKVTVHSDSDPPRPLAFTGSGENWQAVLNINAQFREGQYGFQFEGTDAHGNTGTEIREGPLFRVDRTAPLPPEKVEAVSDERAGPGAVKVRWSPPGQAGANIPHFYRIYRSTEEFTALEAADLVQVFSVTHEGKDTEEVVDLPLGNGTWFYRVTSLDLAGNESGPSALAKVTVSTNTPFAEIRLSTPQSGDAAATRVGRSGAKVVLTTNVPLERPPHLIWFLKAKPEQKHEVLMAGEETRFEGEVRLDLPENAELEEDAEFSFTGVGREGGIEGKSIRSGQTFIADTVGPEARITIPSVYEMRIVANPEGGGELKVPPVKGGRIAVNVELREDSAQVPVLAYTLDDGRAVPVPLTGFGRAWSGWMDIPPGIAQAQGTFHFKAVDLAGNQSTKITRREYPREVDETSFPPRTLRNFATTGGEFEVDSVAPVPPNRVALAAHKLGVVEVRWEAPDGGATSYRLYRSLTPLIGQPPPAEHPIEVDILARLMVDDPPVDGTWFYAVAAVDLAGNESVLSECPSLFVDSIKPELKIKAVPEGEDFVILFPEEEPPTAELTLRFPGQKEYKVTLGGDSGELKRIVREVNGRPVPGYVLPRRAEFFNGKVEVIVHSPDPEGNRVEAITETAYQKINSATGGEVESPDGAVRLEIPAGIEPVIPAGPKEFKRVGGYDSLYFVSNERVPQTATEAAKSQDPRTPDPLPPALTVVGAPYTIHLNEAPKEPMVFKSAATQADLSGLKALVPKLKMKIPETYSDAVKDPEYLKTRLKVVKWVPTPGDTNKRGHWELVPDIEIKTETGEVITPADSITTYVIVSERTPPSIVEAAPDPNGSTRALRPLISAKIVDKGTGVATGAENAIALSVDGHKISPALVKLSTGDPTEVRLEYAPPSDLKPGVHLVSIRAEDVVGNVANYQWRFTLDDRPPAITKLHPADGSGTVVARPTVSALLFDEGGVDFQRSVLRLNGVEVPPAELQFDEPTGLLTWLPRSDLAAGEHKVELTASDRTGQSATRSWRFVIDNEPPAIEPPELRAGVLRVWVRDRFSGVSDARLQLVVDDKPVRRSRNPGEAGFSWDAAEQAISYVLPDDAAGAKIITTVRAHDPWGNHRQGSWLVAEGQPAVALDNGRPSPSTRPLTSATRSTIAGVSPSATQSSVGAMSSQPVVPQGSGTAAAAPEQPPSTGTGRWIWLAVVIVVLTGGAIMTSKWRRRRLRV